jgi:hypothetical protein
LSMTGIFSKTRLFGQSNWRNSVDQVRRSIHHLSRRYCYNADIYIVRRNHWNLSSFSV